MRLPLVTGRAQTMHASSVERLRALYREAPVGADLSWQSPQLRRWRAAALEGLRQTLGFHPLVVQFQGLRFRAGPVEGASVADLEQVPDAVHRQRVQADLMEAQRILVAALKLLGATPEGPTPAPAVPAASAATPAAPAASGAPPGLAAAIIAAAQQDRSLTEAQRAEVAEAAQRLEAALREHPMAWGPAAAALRRLLQAGEAVGRTAILRAAEGLGPPAPRP